MEGAAGLKTSSGTSGVFALRGSQLVHEVMITAQANEHYKHVLEKNPTRHETCKVILKRIAAKGLAVKDYTGSSDPFVKVSLADEKKMHELWKSEVIKNNLAPVWDHLDVQLGPVPLFKPLVIELYDWDMFTAAANGKDEITIHFGSLAPSKRVTDLSVGSEEEVNGEVEITFSITTG